MQQDVLKLGDFGSCRSIYSKQPYTEYISTRWYRAPECLLTDGFYTYKMDLWSAGCVLYEMARWHQSRSCCWASGGVGGVGGALCQGPEAGPRGARPSSGFAPVPLSTVQSLQSFWCRGGFLTRQEMCQTLFLAFWVWRKEHHQLLLSHWPGPALARWASPFGLTSDRTDEAR